jgi:AAA domain/UvrD-like helicase C-terminal domain
VSDYELFPGVFANAEQCQALDQLVRFLGSGDRTFTLVGRGGTGKTTIVREIIERALLQELRVGGGAVSHAAKEVLGESIGRSRVHTVASLLAIRLNEATGEFEPDEWARKLGAVPIREYDLLVIDETSMISAEMMHEILREANPSAQVIFMGDNVQLPPIGDGDDESPTFSISHSRNQAVLTERVRQGEDSPIVAISDVLADNIEGEGHLRALPPEARITMYNPDDDAGVIFLADESEAVQMLVSDLRNDPGNPRGSKAIVFNNERYTRSSQSVLNLNRTIRRQLYGPGAANQFNVGEIVVCYAQWAPSRKAKPLVHNAISYVVEEVSSAYRKQVRARWKGITLKETYSVIDLSLKDHHGKSVTVPVVGLPDQRRYQRDLSNREKAPGALFFRLSEAFANIHYGYAVTSHKAQGSTYRNVYVFEDNILGRTNGSTPVTKNKSLYVAVTRPSHKLVMHSGMNPESPALSGGVPGEGEAPGPEASTARDTPPVTEETGESAVTEAPDLPAYARSMTAEQRDIFRRLREQGLIRLASEL